MEERLPWEDVEASRRNRRLQRKHPVADGKKHYLAAASARCCMNHLRKLGLASFLFLGLGLFCGTSGAWGPAAAGRADQF